MGTKLFGIDVAAIVKGAMAQGLLSVRLLRETVGPLDEADPTAEPVVSYRSFPCRGVEIDSTDDRAVGTQVRQGSRLVLIIGDTLPRGVIPVPGDRIQILGETLEIVGDGVVTDPARATYTCSCG